MSNKEIGTPRIRGKIGIATEPEDIAGKYFFEVFLTYIGCGEGGSLGEFGPFDTEKEAQAELRDVCKFVSQKVEEELTGGVSGKYIDMKTNETRDWNVH